MNSFTAFFAYAFSAASIVLKFYSIVFRFYNQERKMSISKLSFIRGFGRIDSISCNHPQQLNVINHLTSSFVSPIKVLNVSWTKILIFAWFSDVVFVLALDPLRNECPQMFVDFFLHQRSILVTFDQYAPKCRFSRFGILAANLPN